MRRLTTTFAALSDPTRLAMVETLMAQGELPAGALAAGARISAPAISRHLKVLRQAGVIAQRVQGTHRFYSVRPDAIEAIADWTMNHRHFWRGSLDRLDRLLAVDPGGEGDR